jgi:hypothetical protein
LLTVKAKAIFFRLVLVLVIKISVAGNKDWWKCVLIVAKLGKYGRDISYTKHVNYPQRRGRVAL